MIYIQQTPTQFKASLETLGAVWGHELDAEIMPQVAYNLIVIFSVKKVIMDTADEQAK